MSSFTGIPRLDGSPVPAFRGMTPLGDPDHGRCASPTKTGGTDVHVKVFTGVAITFFSSADGTTGTPVFSMSAMNGTTSATPLPADEPMHTLLVRGTLVDDGSIPPIVVGPAGGGFGGANIQVDFDYQTFNQAGNATLRIGPFGSSFGVSTGPGTTSGHFSLSGGDYNINTRAAFFAPGAVWWKYETQGEIGAPVNKSVTISNFTITVTYGTTTRRPCLDATATARESFFFGRDKNIGGFPVWGLAPAALINSSVLQVSVGHGAANSVTARGFVRSPSGTVVNGPTVTVPNSSVGSPPDGQITLGGTVQYAPPINPVTGLAFTGAEIMAYEWGIEILTLVTGECHVYEADLLVDWSPAPPDAAFVTPSDGDTVSGTITVLLTATGLMAPIATVDLFVDYNGGVDEDQIGGTLTSAPFQWTWDTSPYDGQTVTLIAIVTDTQGNSSLPSINVTVTSGPAIPLAITTTSLPGAISGTPYSQVVSAIGGTPPYAFSVLHGPDAIGLNPWALTGGMPLSLSSHASVAYHGAIWITGGGTGSRAVLRSADAGATWAEVGVDALPVPLYLHTMLVFNDRMWVLGGTDGDTATWVDTVYSSADGLTWTVEPPLPVMVTGHASVVFNGQMWVISGYTGVESPRVFSTPDGVTWSEVGVNAFPVPGLSPGASVFGGTIVVTGGYTVMGAFSQQAFALAGDGVTWSSAGTVPVPIAAHGQVTFGGSVWTIGGFNIGGDLDAVYRSTDLVTWTVQPDLLPAPLASLSAVALMDQIVVSGGIDGNSSVETNDVISAFGLWPSTLPPGLSIAMGGTIAGTPAAIGTLVPTTLPNAVNGQLYAQQLSVIHTNATFPFTARVTDAVSATDDQVLSIALDGTGPYAYTLVSGSLPPGLSLQSDGLITGTPPSGGGAAIEPDLLPDGLVDTFYSQQLDVEGPADAFDFVVRASIGSVSLPDAPYSILLTAFGYSTATFAVVSGALPKCLTCSAAGLISGFPIQVGTATFTIRATDASQQTLDADFTLTSAS